MDFLKKIFGGDKKEEGEVSSGQMQGSQGNVPAQDGAPQGEVKNNHDQGHPTGGAGKNVCEFC